jgi:hypothetical protein
MDDIRRHEFPELETKNFMIYGPASGKSKHVFVLVFLASSVIGLYYE